METGTHKIRDLTVEDRDWLSGLIKKLVVRLGNDELLKLLVSDNEAAAETDEASVEDTKSKRYALLVIKIIEMMIDVIGDDVREWFASLYGVTPEEFKKLPFDTELIILEQLADVEDANRFFSRALALSSRIQGFVAGFRSKKKA